MTEHQIIMYKSDIAKLLGITTRTVDKWIKNKYFPRGKYVGGRPVWTKQQVDKWVAEIDRRSDK